jgi:hypothetical protein
MQQAFGQQHLPISMFGPLGLSIYQGGIVQAAYVSNPAFGEVHLLDILEVRSSISGMSAPRSSEPQQPVRRQKSLQIAVPPP